MAFFDERKLVTIFAIYKIAFKITELSVIMRANMMRIDPSDLFPTSPYLVAYKLYHCSSITKGRSRFERPG